MNKEEIQTLGEIFKAFNDHLDEIEAHIRKLDFRWLRSLAAQEWYSDLLTLVTKQRGNQK